MWRRNFVLVTERGGLKDVVLTHCRHVTLVGHKQNWYGSVTEVFLHKGKKCISKCTKKMVYINDDFAESTKLGILPSSATLIIHCTVYTS